MSPTLQQHLSFCRNASVNVQLGGEATAQLDITRAAFEELCRDDFQRIYDPLNRVSINTRARCHEVQALLRSMWCSLTSS